MLEKPKQPSSKLSSDSDFKTIALVHHGDLCNRSRQNADYKRFIFKNQSSDAILIAKFRIAVHFLMGSLKFRVGAIHDLPLL